ncbi:YbaB/EbfC family nucleoid-associated protein [Pelagibacteraceae bacterium]|nr:YbaB/EbfC family nucleoid-associated protein [Pelagibacteraceae bacterium]
MVNLGNMMKQAQQLQKKMSEAQNKLDTIEVEGSSGGGLIKVTATAKGNFKRISIDDSLFKNDEKEILEDLIIAAINDAKQKGEYAAQEEMKSLTGGLPLPPGMKLPF